MTPSPTDLLATARRVVLDDLAPALTGDAKFKALMVANAIAIALRAAEHGEEVAAAAAALGDQAALVAEIRAGGRDGDAALAALLTALAEAACRVSAPKALSL